MGYLPAPLLALLGYLLGLLALPLTGRRRRIVRINLRLCFPERSWLWRTAVGLGHGILLGRFMLDHALFMATSAARMRRLVRLRGTEHLPTAGTPVILLVPHFMGMDAGFVRLLPDHDVCGTYTPQHSAMFEELTRRGRMRLARRSAAETMFSSNANVVAKVVTNLRAGRLLYYLCDLDFRTNVRHVFVPFLGAPSAATITTLPRLARMTGAAVVPCVTRMRLLGGYEVTLGEKWADFPTAHVTADMRRFNEFVGAQIMRSPTQYYWVHRRFKTQPAGSADVYA